MKAVVLEGSFGLENLRLADREDPRPGPGQVLLAMRAASVNYRDLLMARGRYDPRQKLPLVPLSDGVGSVIEVGAGVRRIEVGDRVCPIFCQDWISGEPTKERLRSTLGGPLDGTLAERMVVNAESVVEAPRHLSDAQAATLPCAAVTAWSALFTHGQLRAGDTVLVQGTGGVSLFALQLAKLAGARVIATSSRDEKRERLRSLGADDVVNYAADPKWGATVRELTGGKGVDHVVEVAGGDSLAQSLRAVRPGGRISVIGILGGTSSKLSLLPILMQNVRLQGILVGHREAFEAMARAVAAAGLEPVVDRVFPMNEARAAFERLADGSHFGKVCIEIPSR